MANFDNRFGLLPYDPNGNAVPVSYPYFIPSSDANKMFVGDPIINKGGANTVATGLARQRQPGSFQIIEKVTAGATNRITGTIISINFTDTSGRLIPDNFRPASVDAVVMVCHDPSILYRIQADGAVTNADIGKNADLIFTHAGDEINGLSGAELSSASIGTGITKQLTIIGIVPNSQNELGTNTEVIVRINLPQPFADKVGV